MPYGVGSRASRNRIAANLGRVSSTPKSSGANYIQQEGTIRRHEFQGQINTGLTSGQYHPIILAKFKRSFTATPDDPPTPTASNNYQSSSVFNGSRIENFSAKLFITNREVAITGTAKFLDIYVAALSFWDALILQTVLDASQPFAFSLVSPTEGEVTFKAVNPNFLSPNIIKNFKFLQHYIKHLGTVELSQGLSDDSQVVIDIPDIPAKCRRSQTGMMYCIFILNDAQKNDGTTVLPNITIEESFMEIPSDNRLPFIE